MFEKLFENTKLPTVQLREPTLPEPASTTEVCLSKVEPIVVTPAWDAKRTQKACSTSVNVVV